MAMTQVLIAVDDSESSIKTARIAYALFGDTAQYTVVNVADRTPIVWGGDTLAWGVGYPIMMTSVAPPRVVSSGSDQASGSDAAEGVVDNAPIDAAIQVARDVADEAHLPTAQVVGEVGDPATAIIAAAHHHKADVIVVGPHHRGWISSLFVPSVSEALVREADIPVLIAR
jgi:nucleotide-binding universal stress UspA family protein